MALGTWGGVGPEEAKLLARLVKRAASWGLEEEKEIRAHELRSKIGFSLMMAVLRPLERKYTTVRPEVAQGAAGSPIHCD